MLSIQTPLGPDVLLVNSFTGSERLSGLFSFELELLADVQANKDAQVSADAIVGQPVTVEMELSDHSHRPFHGIVKRFVQYGKDRRFAYYRADVVPWMWLLTLTANCRIFQNLTVPEIVAKIFSELAGSLSGSLPDLVRFKQQITGAYPKWDYCVQYRETDFNFVSRLLEQEGIFYYFQHDSDSHTLIIQDCDWRRDNCGKARYSPEIGYGEREDTITAFEVGEELRPGKYMLRDHLFQLPGKPLQFAIDTQHKRGTNDELEFYDYPGEYAQRVNEPLPDGAKRFQELDSTDAKQRASGQAAVNLRMEEEETAAQICYGSSDCRFLTAGLDFTPQGHPGLQGDYFITSVHHTLNQTPPYCSDFEGRVSYGNSFTCFPASAHYRPARVTPKPIVQGPQTAVVVGRDKEEILVDKYGRVKVQFFWDREGKHDENSSCWIRVSQPWAGKGWGGMWIPRIGQEVIVDFLEGDPDQPIITGRVYNAGQVVPYELPTYQTMSTFKSHTSKEGKSTDYNELRFDDREKAEQLFIRAQRRMDVRVKGSYFDTCHGSRHTYIGWKDKETGDSGGDYLTTTNGEHDYHVVKKTYGKIDDNWHLTVAGEVFADLQALHWEKVKTKSSLNARQIVVEAMQQISLKVGSSSVVIDMTGVTIQAPMVKINSGGSGEMCASAEIAEPLDAEPADSGVPHPPGQKTAGGAPRKRRTHMANALHGLSISREANGNYRFGAGILVAGANADFARQALNDLAEINNTPKGRQTLTDINNSGHEVTIQQRPPNPADPLNASAGTPNVVDATAAGQGVFANNAPWPNAAAQATGTGRGTNATVEYDPTQWPNPTAPGSPSDAVLEHELQHARDYSTGTWSGAPRTDNDYNNGEHSAVGAENGYRANRNEEFPGAYPQRTDYNSGLP